MTSIWTLNDTHAGRHRKESTLCVTQTLNATSLSSVLSFNLQNQQIIKPYSKNFSAFASYNYITFPPSDCCGFVISFQILSGLGFSLKTATLCETVNTYVFLKTTFPVSGSISWSAVPDLMTPVLLDSLNHYSARCNFKSSLEQFQH